MEEKSMKHQSANYVLRDGMEDEVSYYSSDLDAPGPNDLSVPDSPGCAYKALADHAARLSKHEQPDSDKRLAWLEDSNGKIVAEATVRAMTILDDDFQQAIEDEELVILQGESECNDEEIEEIRGMQP